MGSVYSFSAVSAISTQESMVRVYRLPGIFSVWAPGVGWERPQRPGGNLGFSGLRVLGFGRWVLCLDLGFRV